MWRNGRSRAVSQVIVALLLVFIALMVATIFGHMWLDWMQAQTSSGKAMVSLGGAQVWALDGGAAVTVYVFNSGDVRVTISRIRIYSPEGLDCSASVQVPVNPGESKPVSTVFSFDDPTECLAVPITGTIDGWKVFVSVTYTSAAGGGSVGTVVIAEAPSG